MLHKRQLLKIIRRELKKSIAYSDIYSVVNILVDEIKIELMTKKEVLIPNLGKFALKQFKPKKIPNVRTGKMKLTKPYTVLRLYLAESMRRHLHRMIETGDK